MFESRRLHLFKTYTQKRVLKILHYFFNNQRVSEILPHWSYQFQIDTKKVTRGYFLIYIKRLWDAYSNQFSKVNCWSLEIGAVFSFESNTFPIPYFTQ